MKLLPNNILEKMDPKDRKIIHQKTAAETVSDAIAKSEKELQEQIASLLRRKSIPYIRAAMFKRSSLPVGWPDFTFAFFGIPLGWECKTESGELSIEQKRAHWALQACGWRIEVIRSLSQAQVSLSGIASTAALKLQQEYFQG